MNLAIARRRRFDPANAVVIGVAATIFFWWTATDRLDLPKQWMMLATVLLAGIVLGVRRAIAIDWASALGCAATLLALALATGEMGARVESWAGWLAALMLAVIARYAPFDRLTRGLAVVGAVVVLLAWLQALGAPLFNAGLSGLHGRRVVGTLGGPDHLGWTLSALLPWMGTALLTRDDGFAGTGMHTRLRRAAVFAGVVATVGAVVLSGSRAAWAMALFSVPFWLRLRTGRQRWLLAATFLCGLLAAVAADLAVHRANLRQRGADLTSPSGTAAGRLYLVAVHFRALERSSPLGNGPEGFVRRWPALQRTYLAEHPDQARFRSDLRHAHLDAAEVYVDFGLPGLLLGGYLAFVAFRRRSPPGDAPGPAIGCLAAILVGGLAAPVLFFAPTLALAAVALGARLGPPAREPPRIFLLAPLAALLAAGWFLTTRLASEHIRSRATLQRLRGRLVDAEAQARHAVRLDRRNPRAWLELALACETRRQPACARDAWTRVADDLPTDAIRRRLALSEKPSP